MYSGNTVTVGNGNGDSVSFGAFGFLSAPTDAITVGGGTGDSVFFAGSGFTVKVGNGASDSVTGRDDYNNTITLGNGNRDVVNDSSGAGNAITVGNGNDTIYVGNSDTITVGKGHDAFVFQQTTPGSIGAVTINHFNPSNDVITLSSRLTTAVSYQNNSQRNAVITVDHNSSDTITLVGVHSAALHTSDFHFA
jgi:hypothetical protein